MKTPLTSSYFQEALNNLPESPMEIIKKEPYFKRYKYIPYLKEESYITKYGIRYVIDQSFDPLVDIIETLDLVIDTNHLESINKIEIEVGGQRFDVMYINDAYCSYLENTYNSHKHTMNGKMKIPLLMCPLLGEGSIICSSSNVHKITIIVNIKDGYTEVPIDALELWGNTITVSNERRKSLVEKGFDIVTQQTQYTGYEVLRNGKNHIRCNFNHPGYSLYFHFGQDHTEIVSKVKRVSLVLDDLTYYEGPIELLFHGKDYVEIPFIDKLHPTLTNNYVNGFWNFSTIDRAILSLDIEGLVEKEYKVYVFLHSYQIMRYVQGMYGLTYSK